MEQSDTDCYRTNSIAFLSNSLAEGDSVTILEHSRLLWRNNAGDSLAYFEDMRPVTGLQINEIDLVSDDGLSTIGLID